MNEFQLDDNDVVSMPQVFSFTKTDIFKIGVLKQALREHLKGFTPSWIDEGVPCEILKTTGGGWQKGKFRLRWEFIPDEPGETGNSQ